ncbi:unnamed protein product [Lampetra planeri]
MSSQAQGDDIKHLRSSSGDDGGSELLISLDLAACARSAVRLKRADEDLDDAAHFLPRRPNRSAGRAAGRPPDAMPARVRVRPLTGPGLLRSKGPLQRYFSQAIELRVGGTVSGARHLGQPTAAGSRKTRVKGLRPASGLTTASDGGIGAPAAGDAAEGSDWQKPPASGSKRRHGKHRRPVVNATRKVASEVHLAWHRHHAAEWQLLGGRTRVDASEVCV